MMFMKSFLFFPSFFILKSTVPLVFVFIVAYSLFVCICAVYLLSIWPVGCVSQCPQNKDTPLLPSTAGERSKQACGGKWIQSNAAALVPCCLDLSLCLLTDVLHLSARVARAALQLDGMSSKLTSRCLRQLSDTRRCTDFCVNLDCTTWKMFRSNLENLLRR